MRALAMRAGIDLGGTKIEIAVLNRDSSILLRERISTPQDDYAATVRAVKELVLSIEKKCGTKLQIGMGVPGTISPASGLMKNANSVWLNGKPLDRDIELALDRKIRVANDANCFTLSEAVDGAGRHATSVFGVILGTGVGGGIAINKRIIVGAHAIAGEWGHNPLPLPIDEGPQGNLCFCGRHGCIETYLSGPGLAADYAKRTGKKMSAEDIVEQAAQAESHACASMERYFDRLARALGTIINILDPDIIVLGGGLSNMSALYEEVPQRLAGYVFSDVCTTPILKNMHGDSSGVRGAAWLCGNDTFTADHDR